MEDQLKQYQEGFNHGYILQKHAPELIEFLTSHSNPENEYFSGLVAGKQEHQMEKIRQSVKSNSKQSAIIKEADKEIGKNK